MYLHRLQTGKTIGHTDLGGRTFRLVENEHKGNVTMRSLVVSGGPYAARVDASSYRTAARRTFDIDPIVVRPETSLDRVGKQLGLNVEAVLGDDAIDDRFYFESRTRPELVKDLFDDPPLRAALLAALSRFQVVVIGPPGGAVAGVQQSSPGRLTLTDAARVRVLEELAAALPEIRARAPRSPFAHVAPQIGAVFALEGSVGVGVMLATSSDYLVSAMVLIPVLAGVAAAFVLAWTALYFAFRRRSDGFRSWLLVSLVSLVGLPFLSVGIAARLNSSLDESRATRYEVTVTHYQPRIKNKQRGLLRVKGLPASLVEQESGDAEIEWRWMPRPSCKRLALDVHPGYFGVPWVSKVACLPGG